MIRDLFSQNLEYIDDSELSFQKLRKLGNLVLTLLFNFVVFCLDFYYGRLYLTMKLLPVTFHMLMSCIHSLSL